jgi:hypothetical protein
MFQNVNLVNDNGQIRIRVEISDATFFEEVDNLLSQINSLGPNHPIELLFQNIHLDSSAVAFFELLKEKEVSCGFKNCVLSLSPGALSRLTSISLIYTTQLSDEMVGSLAPFLEGIVTSRLLINFQFNNMTEASLVKIGEKIGSNHFIRDLAIRSYLGNRISTLVSRVACNQSIERLDLATNMMSDTAGIYELFKMQNLRHLVLDRNNFAKPEALGGLYRALPEMKNLESLSLVRCMINNSSANELFTNLIKRNIKRLLLAHNFLESGNYSDIEKFLKENKNIRELDLSNNFSANDTNLANDFFKKLTNYTLEKLVLANCRLNLANGLTILDHLADQKSLKSLDLSLNLFNDDSSQNDPNRLANKNQKKKRKKTVQTLQKIMADNKEKEKNANETLQRLNLNDCRITSYSSEQLFSKTHFENLCYLSLSNSQLSAKGLQYLIANFINPFLDQKIDLSNARITSTKKIAKLIVRSPNSQLILTGLTLFNPNFPEMLANPDLNENRKSRLIEANEEKLKNRVSNLIQFKDFYHSKVKSLFWLFNTAKTMARVTYDQEASFSTLPLEIRAKIFKYLQNPLVTDTNLDKTWELACVRPEPTAKTEQSDPQKEKVANKKSCHFLTKRRFLSFVEARQKSFLVREFDKAPKPDPSLKKDLDLRSKPSI